jgi:hypothetical protein
MTGAYTRVVLIYFLCSDGIRTTLANVSSTAMRQTSQTAFWDTLVMAVVVVEPPDGHELVFDDHSCFLSAVLVVSALYRKFQRTYGLATITFAVAGRHGYDDDLPAGICL